MLRYIIKDVSLMAKIYSKKQLAKTNLLPKKETINFILNYSKAITITRIGNMNFEILAN